MARARRAFRALECLEARRLLAAAARPAILVGVPERLQSRVIPLLEQHHSVGAVTNLSHDVLRVEPVAGTSLAALSTRLRRLDGVRFVERDTTIQVQAVTPSDPGFAQQWGLESPANFDINASAAWDFSTGSAGTIVAVIDSGIDVHHPDLAGRLWTNPREIAGNFADDDANGFTDDIHGWSFLDNTANLSDDAGHGSHVAGIIGAASNNGIGVTGVDWHARLMILKFIDSAGNGALSDAVRAIHYAIANGARVINASWGGSTPSKALNDAIRAALNQNVVFVTAAGNEAANNDVYRSYPASYRMANVLVVAAANQAGQLAGFSNFGRKTVDLAAPGVDIRSTLSGGGYGTISGTSMAAPFVTGVVSLLVSQNPGASAAGLVKRVVGTTRPLASLSTRTISGGLVDAAAALNPNVPTRSLVPATNQQAKARKTPRVVVKSRLSRAAGDNTRASILGTDAYYSVKGGTNEAFLHALYRDVVGRSISSKEYVTWTAALNAGVARSQIARSLLGTNEAQRTKVARWYQRELAAPASLAMLKRYGPATRLAQQMYARVAESAVHASLYGSGEYLRLHGGSAASVISGYYRTILGREVSEAEAGPWLEQLARGAKFSDIALALLASPEGRRTRVALWYQSDLGAADSLDNLKNDPGVIAWAAQLVD
jgi:subtilisin family serine protease